MGRASKRLDTHRAIPDPLIPEPMTPAATKCVGRAFQPDIPAASGWKARPTFYPGRHRDVAGLSKNPGIVVAHAGSSSMMAPTAHFRLEGTLAMARERSGGVLSGQLGMLYSLGTVGDLERWPAPGTVPGPGGPGGVRGGVRRAGRTARADGPARLSADPGRSARRPRRLPGHVPAPGPQGGDHPEPRVGRRLAVPHRAAGRGTSAASTPLGDANASRP